MQKLDSNDEQAAIDEAFKLGWNSALTAITSDVTYYEALKASPAAYVSVEEAAEFVGWK